MLVSQVQGPDNSAVVAVRELGEEARAVKNAGSVYELAMEAATAGKSLASVIEAHGLGDAIDLKKVRDERRFLPPITHPDPAHVYLTGTGLIRLPETGCVMLFRKHGTAQRPIYRSLG